MKEYKIQFNNYLGKWQTIGTRETKEKVKERIKELKNNWPEYKFRYRCNRKSKSLTD